jgi:hypothetical protein
MRLKIADFRLKIEKRVRPASAFALRATADKKAGRYRRCAASA